MLQALFNIGRNSVKRKNFTVMSGKVLRRLKEAANKDEKHDFMSWYKTYAEPYEEFTKALDADLWNEALKASAAIKKAGEKKLETLGLDLGGGGNYPMLYFFTRYLKAQTVVETGVAAGWSSQAILKALKENGKGQLYSSDFPYFRYKNPEELVGYIVNKTLKKDWHLFIDGDQNNLPQIAEQLDKPIDLFQYDSDKSYEGRTLALKILAPHLTEKTTIIFDDIQDNAHFKDHVETTGAPFKIFEFEGKYIGLIAPYL